MKNYLAHETAVIDPNSFIGADSKIWHFSHIMKNATLGKGCNVGQNVVVSPGVVLGNNVKVQKISSSMKFYLFKKKFLKKNPTTINYTNVLLHENFLLKKK